MAHTYWVTFSDPKLSYPCPTVDVRKSAPESVNPRTFVVQFDHDDREEWRFIQTRAIALARQQYDVWLDAYFASQLPQKSAPLPKVVVKPPERVFTAQEIEPFLDEMLARMVAVAGCGIRLELSDSGTAETDCRHFVRFNPEPFLLGQIESGLGRGLHEVGHIRYDQNGTRKDQRRASNEQAVGAKLLAQAYVEGGEILGNILNLVMDRRCDDLHVKEFPGNANALYHRLGYLLPGQRRDEDGPIVDRRNGTLLSCKTSVLSDFTYAIKKRTRPKHAVVRKCVNLAKRAIRRVNTHKRSYTHLLYVCAQILNLLRQHMTVEEKKHEIQIQRSEDEFGKLMQALKRAIYGKQVDAEFAEHFRQMIARKLSARRIKSLALLPKQLAALQTRPSPPGAGSGGGAGVGSAGGEEKGVVKVSPNPVAYQAVVLHVRREARIVAEILKRLSIPEAHSLRGLTRGDFDLDALSVLATGGSECMKIDLRRLLLDLAIAFLLDVSGSMDALKASIELAVAFNEGIIPSRRSIDSRFFAFNEQVFDCGGAQPNNGIAGVPCTGGTLEDFGVRVAGHWLRQSRRLRRILVTICDGAPAYIDKTKKEVDALLGAGILPIRILVGVDVAPQTYPVELFFDNWPEFYREFGKIFETVIRAARLS